MSKYTVIAENDKVRVECDGEPIALNPLRRSAEPLYEFGGHSDGTVNLAHSILCHCRSSEEDLSLDFVNEFLINKTDVPYDIGGDTIKAFAELTLKARTYGQEADWKPKQT